MHYIVTGGAGFIGSNLAEELAQSNDVTILDNLSSGRWENIRSLTNLSRVNFIEGSVNDYSLLAEICEGVDGIFHQAAQVYVQKSISDPLETHTVNATGTLNVLLSARDYGVRKVICASSAAIYGNRPELPKTEDMEPDPLSPYAASKIAAEYYGKVFSDLYGLQTVFLRYFNVFGPRQDPNSQYAAVIPKFITLLLAKQRPTIYGNGSQTRDFVYVKDVVRANILAMESDARGVFNIARGEQLSINQLIVLLSDLMEQTIDPRYESSSAGDVKYSVADIKKAKEAFGFSSAYDLRQALQETIYWFQSNEREKP